VDRGVAEVFVEVLARKGFPGRVADGPDEKTFRVLVGPLEREEIPQTKSALDRAGFTAFVRTY
jgi:cell division protein FtsN